MSYWSTPAPVLDRRIIRCQSCLRVQGGPVVGARVSFIGGTDAITTDSLGLVRLPRVAVAVEVAASGYVTALTVVRPEQDALHLISDDERLPYAFTRLAVHGEGLNYPITHPVAPVLTIMPSAEFRDGRREWNALMVAIGIHDELNASVNRPDLPTPSRIMVADLGQTTAPFVIRLWVDPNDPGFAESGISGGALAYSDVDFSYRTTGGHIVFSSTSAFYR